MGIRHILTIVAVADLEASVRFYRQAFGWTERVNVPVFVEFVLDDGRAIGLYRREAFAHNTGVLPAVANAHVTTATELYLHCDDLNGAINRIQEAGARELSARAEWPWGDEAAYYADLDGNVLVLARPVGG